MIQTKLYVVSADFVSNYKKLDYEESTILWDIIHKPSTTTIDMIIRLLFNQSSIDKNKFKRYHLNNNTSSFDNICSSNPTNTRTTNHTLVTPINLANTLINTCRQNPTTTSTSNTIYHEEDYISLSNYNFYDNNNRVQVIDAYGNMQSSTHICPPTIDEMMNIIRQVKNNQLNINDEHTCQSVNSSCNQLNLNDEQTCQSDGSTCSKRTSTSSCDYDKDFNSFINLKK
jgi:hypothetical protein